MEQNEEEDKKKTKTVTIDINKGVKKVIKEHRNDRASGSVGNTDKIGEEWNRETI